MLTKLGWEMSTLLDALKHSDMRVGTYFALNGCLTAWHMCDWLATALDNENRWGDARQAMKVSTRDELIHAVLAQPPLAICHQIANATKHVFLDRGYKPGYQATYAKLPVDEMGRQHGLFIETPDGVEEIVWVLYRGYLWWASTLKSLGYSVEPDAPIISVNR
ncbi:MAG: hypothetical protein ABI227_00175 [Rhodanobacter sp.]